jgi:acetamidase/formamidase
MAILAGRGDVTVEILEPDERTLHGSWDRDRAPVVTVDPGTTVRVGTLDSGWFTGPHTDAGLATRPRHPAHDPASGHALTGPVAVRGAEPGQVLAVRIDDVVPGAFGTTYCGLRSTALNERLGVLAAPVVHSWTLDADAGIGRNQAGHSVALRPFLGVLGVPPAEPGEHSTIPPYWHGGNLDCRELVAGATLYLPVTVPGGLLSVGDGHAAQGDGEVSGTAIECPIERADLTLDVLPDLFGAPVRTPVARTPAGWVTMGVADDLDEAMAIALDAMLDVLAALHDVSRSDALALASVVVDLRVTQVVNQVVGVHAVLPWGAIR